MIHVIIGAPCSGKSTYVDENMSDGDVRIDYDKIAWALGCFKGHMPEDPVKSVAFAARKAAIDKAIELDAETWIIHSRPSKEQMAAYEAAGAEFVEMDTPMHVCVERAIADGRPEQTIAEIEKFFGTGKGARMPNIKDMVLSVKADGEAVEEGRILAYASTFDRDPDSYGDVVAKGAFVNCLADLEQKGQKLPVLFGHRTDDPLMNIGIVEECHEDEKGLLCDIKLDLDNPNGAYAYKLVKEGRLCKLSFAFDVLDAATVTLADGTKANELRELYVYEVSLVPIPANQHAQVVDVKSGRRNSAKDEGVIKQVIELLSGLICEVEEEQEKAETEEPSEGQADANGEEPDEAKAKAAQLLSFIGTMNKEG